ncbi:MAG: ABC transporter permease [Romboutsia sp.]|uniref:ABC transporter permease n=1 Tax=Romboutsia sp. TaxID=1965302 RepID=UPI003F36EDF4
MRNIMIILKHNLKSLKNTWLFLIILIPIVMSFFVGKMTEYQKGLLDTRISIGVYSNDKSEFLDIILPKDEFKEIKMINSKNELEALVKDEELFVGVIIDSKDIYEDIKNNKENFIEVISNSNLKKEDQVLNILNNTTSKVNLLGQNKEETLSLIKEYEKEQYKFSSENSSLQDNIVYMTAFGLFTMVFLFIGGKGLNPLIKERESKIDKRIIVSNVSKVEYILGNVLGCFIVLMMQSIILLISLEIFNTDFNVSFTWMIILCFALTFVAIAIGLFVLSMAKTSTSYYAILSMVVTPFCLISGGFVPSEFMPENIQKVAMISPLTWINEGFKNILYGSSTEKIVLNILAAISISIVFIVIYLLIESRRKNKFI